MRDNRKSDRRQGQDRRSSNRGIVDRRGQRERREGQQEKNYKRPDFKKANTRKPEFKSELKQEETQNFNNKEERDFDDQVEGRNAVLELLESKKDINKIYVIKGEKHGSINKILAIAKENRVIVVEKDRRQMDEMAQNENYQGVIAIVPPFEYCEVEDILQVAKDRNEKPFVIILDGIEDPHNLGAIIRTAETAGAHGIIIPKRRAVGVNSTVNKVSAGAAQHMKIARVNNVTDSINKLKEEGLWICGTDINTDKYYYNEDYRGPIGIVIGNEGNGMSDKVTKNCDFLVKIPMKGKVTSLNASVSAGIIIYEVVKQRI